MCQLVPRGLRRVLHGLQLGLHLKKEVVQGIVVGKVCVQVYQAGVEPVVDRVALPDLHCLGVADLQVGLGLLVQVQVVGGEGSHRHYHPDDLYLMVPVVILEGSDAKDPQRDQGRLQVANLEPYRISGKFQDLLGIFGS